MDPIVNKIVENNGILEFTLQNVDVSIANSIRRVVLSEIEVNAFITENFEENDCKIFENTSRFHNEIVKQRLSCIPIHMSDLDMLPGKYILEVKKENTEKHNIYVTTEDFKIKNKDNNNYLTSEEVKKIFPADEITGDYLLFVRLRPQWSSQLPGEKLHLECEFSKSNAKENGMYNVASICSFGNTMDMARVHTEWNNIESSMKSNGLTEKEIEFERKNFMLLDAQRIFVDKSFDFSIKGIGIYENKALVYKACDIMIKKLEKFMHDIDADIVFIRMSENTLEHSFDIIMEDEDYTLGKVIECMVYEKYFEKEKMLEFCGFKKMHPHDTQSVLRMAYIMPMDKAIIKQHLKGIVTEVLVVYKSIMKMFS
jgi:DNA-directed RNA polymerase subunit L